MVFGLPPSVRIYIATETVDMRNGIDGLRARVEAILKKDPYEGHLFVFIGKAKDKVKILFWYPFGEPRQDAGTASVASSSTWGIARRSRSSSPRRR